MVPRSIAAALTALALAFAPSASADVLLPPNGRILTGMSGGKALNVFSEEVGKRPGVFGFFTMFDQPNEYIFRAAERTQTRLMLHISTHEYYGMPQVVTPRGIARGSGDRYLVGLNRRIAQYGEPTYIRFLAEMNQANNGYSAFDRSGRSRGPSHSTKAFVAGWRRATLILRGGPVPRINAELRGLRLPPLRGVAAGGALPEPPVAMMWVPQTAGSPPIHANRPQAYWPGSRYVDWVGTDFYSRFPNFDLLERFYRDFAGKPFVFGEWAMWGADDPAFARRFLTWVRTHERVRMLLYNQGKSDSPFRLRLYPRARRAIADELSRPVFG